MTTSSYLGSSSFEILPLNRAIQGAKSGGVPEPSVEFSNMLTPHNKAGSPTPAISAAQSQSPAVISAASDQRLSKNLPSPVISADTMSALLTASAESSASVTRVGTAHLLANGAPPDFSKVPSVADFMAATGADFSTASDVLYGTIGSNLDLRDWGAIMASSDPLADARASTAAMYNSGLDYVSSEATNPKGSDVVSKSGNFEYANIRSETSESVAPSLVIIDAKGNILTTPGSSIDLTTRAKNFGFDTSALSKLEAQLDAAGVKFRTGPWLHGFVSSPPQR